MFLLSFFIKVKKVKGTFHFFFALNYFHLYTTLDRISVFF